MRALVTGAAGFIGSTLTDRLLREGWRVRGVDCFTPYYDPTVKRSNIAPALADPNFELVEGDLNDIDLAATLADVDVVFHQAAQPGVRQSWASGFDEYARHNVLATQRLLEAARDARDRHQRLQRFVYASSSSVYGQVDNTPTEETNPTDPHSPYGVTKLAGEHLCRAYAANFGLPTVSLRYFTVFGPRHRPDMSIHRLIEAARRHTTFELYGDGSHVRDFTYVDDIVAANLAAATADVPLGAAFNIAGGSSVTIATLIELIGEAVGSPVPVVHRPAMAGDVLRTGGSIDRARQELGWNPLVTLEQGIARQVAWHDAHLPLVEGHRREALQSTSS